jgi:hypothetical protein
VPAPVNVVFVEPLAVAACAGENANNIVPSAAEKTSFIFVFIF